GAQKKKAKSGTVSRTKKRNPSQKTENSGANLVFAGWARCFRPVPGAAVPRLALCRGPTTNDSWHLAPIKSQPGTGEAPIVFHRIDRHPLDFRDLCAGAAQEA